MGYNTSSDYRRQARMAMSGKYWYMFGVSLLAMLVSGIGGGIAELFKTGDNFIEAIAAILCSLFVSIPINVGLIRFFIVSAKDNTDLTELIYPYKNGLMNVIITKIKKEVFVLLWSLLFIIPGIVASFSYFMVDYLIAENPNMDSRRAFEISKRAMEGYRLKVFLLGLSFIGWVLLGLCAFGVGVLFVEPYIQTAYVELYEDIKQNAIMRGIMSEDELSTQNVL